MDIITVGGADVKNNAAIREFKKYKSQINNIEGSCTGSAVSFLADKLSFIIFFIFIKPLGCPCSDGRAVSGNQRGTVQGSTGAHEPVQKGD